MRVTLRRLSAATFAPDEATVTWRHALARAWGEATISLPKSSPAYSQQYVSPDAGSFVTIDDPAGGYWAGVVDRIEEQGSSKVAVLRCRQLPALFDNVPVGFTANLRNLTAGTLARAALRSSPVGVKGGALFPGTFVEAAPAIGEYTFSGQSVATVFFDLMDRSGQEFNVSVDGRVDWTGPIGSWVETVLCDGSQFVNSTAEVTRDGNATRVIVADAQGRETRWRSAEDGNLVERVRFGTTSKVGTPAAQEARDLMRRVRGSRTQVEGGIPRTMLTGVSQVVGTSGGWGYNWGFDWGGGVVVSATTSLGTVTDGDWLTLILPRFGVNGMTVRGRIVERSISARSTLVGFKVLGYVNPTTIDPKFLQQVAGQLPNPGLLASLASIERALGVR